MKFPRSFWVLTFVLLGSTLAAQRSRTGAGAPTGGVTLEPPTAPSTETVLDFGAARAGEPSERTYALTNSGTGRLVVTDLSVVGNDASAFRVLTKPQIRSAHDPRGLRPGLAPGQTMQIRIAFEPNDQGAFDAELQITANQPITWQNDTVTLIGHGVGALGQEVLVNAGGLGFQDSLGQSWGQEYGFVGGSLSSTLDSIAGTNDPILYRHQRASSSFSYSLPLVDFGTYEVTLHFAEITFSQNGARVFDVHAEGALVLDDLDVHALVGHDAAYSVTFEGETQDGILDLQFDASIGEASLAGIEVRGVPLVALIPPAYDFGAVSTGSSAETTLMLENRGVVDVTVESIGYRFGASGNSQAFSLDFGGQTFPGAAGSVTYGASIQLPKNSVMPAVLAFAPTSESFDQVLLDFNHTGGVETLDVSGLGGHEGDPFLHVVIDSSAFVVDYDADGSEAVTFLGAGSHTHEPGRSIVGYDWTNAGQSVSSSPDTTQTLSVGGHDLTLEIEDDNTVPRTLSLATHVDVLQTSEVPGLLAQYFPTTPGNATNLLDNVPSNAGFAEILSDYLVAGTSTIGGSPFTTNTMVQLRAQVAIASDDTYEFLASGGVDQRLELDGAPISGPQFLVSGTYDLEARFAVDGLGDLPLDVQLSVGGGGSGPIGSAMLTHDETSLIPVINSMPTTGTTSGGNLIRIQGLGFFPDASVQVHWGATTLTQVDFDVLRSDLIEFDSPPGSAGTINVTVQSPNGTSNAVVFTYDPGGPVPIQFQNLASIPVPKPTAGAWGPDGRLYVTSLDGRLSILEFDENWNVVSQQIHPGVSGLTNNDTLGIAFNPYDPPTPVRVYVGHGEHFLNGGAAIPPGETSPYTGQVSMLEGPNFDVPTPLVTGLPTSNHDHAINELIFTDNGDLLINVGSNTNAGVPHPNIGELPESPLSAAMVLAKLSKPGFNGTIEYLETDTGLPNDDQVFGHLVDVAPGVDVVPYAHGLRNPYGAVLHTNGYLYSSDNGPNAGFGAASLSATTEGPDPQDTDEVLLVEYDGYYGSANRNRGRYDTRQNVYYPTSIGSQSSIPETFRQCIANVPSSTNGIDEYRADAFKGQIRGDLLAQEWGSRIRRLDLSADGRKVQSVTDIGQWTGALDFLTGPGGALVALDYSSNAVKIQVPVDSGAGTLEAYEITPWRAPASGGTLFTIGGVGFGTLADTTVTIGGLPAVLTEVTPKRIHGVIPSEPAPTGEFVDVTVTVGTSSDTYAQGFRYLMGEGQALGSWTDLTPLPTSLGELAAGVIDGKLFLVGDGDPGTYVFDLSARLWLNSPAARPLVGHSHAAEVLDGKLYLIGGLGAGSEGRVQIFDPVSKTWSLDPASMPWAAGAASTAVIDGKIYACGGIVGTSTADTCAVYEPSATVGVPGVWTMLSPMPAGRNNAAANTDGSSLYVFGGRTGDNVVTNGFDDVQVYDPLTNTWETSATPGSAIPPLPQARGGMGRALFWRGEFYIFGGETQNDPGATANQVYDRVDVYDPAAGTWRLDKPMASPRQGIYPVLYESHMYLPGGGTSAGAGGSTVFDEFRRL